MPLQLARVVISPTSGSLSRLDLLYPYRVDDSLVNYALADTSDWNYHSGIGELIFCLDDNLKSNEVYLLGQEVLISEYPKLYELWGDTYGVASSNLYFVLPDFSNRVLQGTTTGTYGYIEAGLPDIYGQLADGKYEVTGSGSNSITTTSTVPSSTAGAMLQYGALQWVKSGYSKYQLAFYDDTIVSADIIRFQASLWNSIYGNSETVQPPSVLCLVKTRYQ